MLLTDYVERFNNLGYDVYLWDTGEISVVCKGVETYFDTLHEALKELESL